MAGLTLMSRALLPRFFCLRASTAAGQGLWPSGNRHPCAVISRNRHMEAAVQRLPLQPEKKRFTLNLDTINPNLKRVQYAVRGPVLDRAMEIDADLLQVLYYFLLH